MNNKIILIIAVFVLSFSISKAQDDFTIILNETEINKALDAVIAARGLNFGEYENEQEDKDITWFANVNNADIDILPNNKAILKIYDAVLVGAITSILSFQVVEHRSGLFDAEIKLINDPIKGTQLMIDVSDISDMQSWGDLTDLYDWFKDLIGYKEIVPVVPDISLSLSSLTPNLFSTIFVSDAPNIISSNTDIRISYNIKGYRFLNVENKVEERNDLGNIYLKEGTAFVGYNSPKEFPLDYNSSQTFKSDENTILYQSNNYKFNAWNDDNKEIQRSTIMNDDNFFKAEFQKAIPSSFNIKLESTIDYAGSINIDYATRTTPVTDYVLKSPNTSNISAPAVVTYNNRPYYFSIWNDGVLTANRTVSPLTTTNYTANYKGSMLTWNNASFANNSQRKLLKSSDGRLHVVYESRGCIWYETSTDNGSTWKVMNGGRPINNISDNGTASSPSIDVSTGSAYIVYQLGSPYYQIEFAWFNYIGDTIGQRLTVTSSINDKIIKTTPVIAQNSNSTIYSRMIVIWSSPGSTLGTTDEGIFYRIAKYNPSTLNWEWTTDETKITGTNKYSINPTIGYKEIVTPLDFHIAWEESNNIKYTYLRALSDGSATLGALETPSSGGEFSYNFKPSITVTGSNSVKLAWLSATEPGMDGAISFRSKTGTAWGSFWSFLDTFEPDFVSINKIGTAGEFAFVYGMAEYFNYICKNASQSNKLGTQEKYMQLANSPGTTITAVSHKTQGSLIPLNVKNISLSTLQKSSANDTVAISNYRGVTFFKNSSALSCRFGGISLNQQEIEFANIDYQDGIKEISQGLKYLTTEPFTASEAFLSFNMKTSIKGKLEDILGENQSIKFRVDLIEQSSGDVYTLKEIALIKKSVLNETEMHISLT